ncbi:MAG: DUF5077 domain-containing protein, partial [Lentisphaeria bacterium]
MQFGHLLKIFMPASLAVGSMFAAIEQVKTIPLSQNSIEKSVNTKKVEEKFNSILLAGNAYVTKGFGVVVSREGITAWRNKDAIVSTYFHLSEPNNKVKLAIKASGNSVIKVTAAG